MKKRPFHFRTGSTLIGATGCFALLLSLGMMTTACEIDAYEKGEGKYSLLTADFVEATIGSDRYVSYVETDEGQRLIPEPKLTANWIEKSDTTYRAVLYYKKRNDGKAEAVSFSRVGVLIPFDTLATTKGESMKTDPLHVESAWKSTNGKYLNLRLRLMTGATESEQARHTIGILRDTMMTTPTHAYFTLYHNQGGCPEYYSQVAYACLPLSMVAADSVTITINTYDGTFNRCFAIK